MSKKSERSQRYIVALPDVNMDVSGYNQIKLIGTTYATTPAAAVGNHLHSQLKRSIAPLIQAKLRDEYGGAENYAMELAYPARDGDGNLLHGVERLIDEEIRVCMFIEEVSRETNLPQDSYRHIDLARKLLNEFKKKRNQKR